MIAVLMIFAVQMLLMLAAGYAFGEPGKPLPIFLGALTGTGLTAISMWSRLPFFESFLWGLCILAVAAVVAYGISREGLLKGLLFVLFQLSLGGLTDNRQQLSSMLLGAAGLGFASLGLGKAKKYIPVELCYEAHTLHFLALRDTGNTLRDPITGRPVLVVDANIAKTLTGMEVSQLSDPVNNLTQLPGLRLIPYQTVGNTGFLLALQIPQVTIGRQQGSAVVAFSPCTFANHYQALTGGTL